MIRGVLSASRSPRLTIALVSLGVLFTALDQTVVATVLPEIMLDMKLPVTELDRAAWIITGYLIGYTVAIPIVARLSDVYGHARLFGVSLGLFALGSVLVAVAPNLSWLVASRIVQAMGGGATIPIGMAMATRTMPRKRRVLAIGIIGAAAEAGVMLGPLYGGGIAAVLNWRWLFWLNLPQVAILLLVLRLIPSERLSGTRMDYRGGVLLAGALTLLVVALSQRELSTASSLTPYLLGGFGLLALGALSFVEIRASHPLLPGRFFRSLAGTSALAAKLAVGAALILVMVTVPLMANTVLGLSPLEGGLRLMRFTGALAVGAVIGGFSAYRFGLRTTTVAGLALGVTGLFLMSGWDAEITNHWHTVHLVVAGLGFGLVIAPIVITSMDTVTADYQATAASLVTVARMMGMALGMAALSAWGMERFQGLTEGLLFPLPRMGEAEEALTQRLLEYQAATSRASIALFQSFFRVGALLLLAAVVPALGLRRRREEMAPRECAQMRRSNARE